MKNTCTIPTLILIACLMFMNSFSVVAQDTVKSFSPDQKARCHEVTFNSEKVHIVNRLFKSVHVYDVRPDTTKLGYVWADITNVLLKLSIPANEFNKYFNLIVPGYSNSNYDLDIFITKAWIVSDIHNKNDLSLSAELFMKTELGYHPLYKYDTTVKKQGTTKAAISELENMMIASTVKLNSVNIQQKLKKVISPADIELRYNTSRFEVGKPSNKGVYMSLNEFKTDNPSYKDFQIDFNEATDELYIRQTDGSFMLTRKAWGFYDGQNLFIRMGENYFPVDQNGSTLTFYGAAELKKEAMTHFHPPPSGISAAAVLIDYLVSSKRRKLVKLKPCQLNTFTGEIY